MAHVQAIEISSAEHPVTNGDSPDSTTVLLEAGGIAFEGKTDSGNRFTLMKGSKFDEIKKRFGRHNRPKVKPIPRLRLIMTNKSRLQVRGNAKFPIMIRSAVGENKISLNMTVVIVEDLGIDCLFKLQDLRKTNPCIDEYEADGRNGGKGK